MFWRTFTTTKIEDIHRFQVCICIFCRHISYSSKHRLIRYQKTTVTFKQTQRSNQDTHGLKMQIEVRRSFCDLTTHPNQRCRRSPKEIPSNPNHEPVSSRFEISTGCCDQPFVVSFFNDLFPSHPFPPLPTKGSWSRGGWEDSCVQISTYFNINCMPIRFSVGHTLETDLMRFIMRFDMKICIQACFLAKCF